MKPKIPLTHGARTIFTRPIRCPKTKYKASDTEILTKPGDGNFGEVVKVPCIYPKIFLRRWKHWNKRLIGRREKVSKKKCFENVVNFIGTVQIETGNRDEIRILL